MWFGVKNEYKFLCRDRNGETLLETRWTPNLITNSGLSAYMNNERAQSVSMRCVLCNTSVDLSESDTELPMDDEKPVVSSTKINRGSSRDNQGHSVDIVFVGFENEEDVEKSFNCIGFYITDEEGTETLFSELKTDDPLVLPPFGSIEANIRFNLFCNLSADEQTSDVLDSASNVSSSTFVYRWALGNWNAIPTGWDFSKIGYANPGVSGQDNLKALDQYKCSSVVFSENGDFQKTYKFLWTNEKIPEKVGTLVFYDFLDDSREIRSILNDGKKCYIGERSVFNFELKMSVSRV